MKELTSESYKFLWSGKPDRIKKSIATLPVATGGLNMPNIEQFWNSLKISWVRRLASSESAWVKILQVELQEINYDIREIWYKGPEDFSKIAKQI